MFKFEYYSILIKIELVTNRNESIIWYISVLYVIGLDLIQVTRVVFTQIYKHTYEIANNYRIYHGRRNSIKNYIRYEYLR